MCDRRTLVWLPLVSMTMLVVLSGQGCPTGIERPSPCWFNTPPIANAGPDQERDLGNRVFLDGTGSSDVDGDSLSYHWQMTRGPAQIVLEGAETARPEFVPPAEGEYQLSVMVSDTCGESDEDTVVIAVGSIDPVGCPEARARTDQAIIDGGVTAVLNGSTSIDLGGNPLTHSWRQTGGPEVDIANPYIADTTFVAPQVTQDVQLEFELTVSNGTCSDTNTITIAVRGNVETGDPVANAGLDQQVNEGATVTLDGSASSDPSSLQLTYSWSQIGSPVVTLVNPKTAKPTFIAPGVTANVTLVFRLTVSNGTKMATDDVSVFVTDIGPDADGDLVPDNLDNCPTVPNPNQANTDGDTAGDACDGCLNDPNKTASGQCGCGVADNDSDADGVADCSDDCPGTPAGQTVDANGCATSQKDSDGDGVKDNVDQCPSTPAGSTVDAIGCLPFSVNAGTDQTATSGQSVSLSATVTNAVGSVFYQWTQTAGPTVTISNASSAQASFVALSVTASTTLTFTVTAIDGTGRADPDTVNVVVTPASPATVTLDLGNGVSMRFAYVPAGTYSRGSDTGEADEKPVRQITISHDFYIGVYEVTQAQWQKVMGSNPSRFKGSVNLPVEEVGWQDCVTFCQAMSTLTGRTVRLPTEAEWEYACRAGTETSYFWGDSPSPIDQYAWTSTNAGGITHEVGLKQPNAFGLYDICGNVKEWCADWYDATYYPVSPDTDPAGPASGTYRVLRGGAWLYGADPCRSANRDWGGGSANLGLVGFRVIVEN